MSVSAVRLIVNTASAQKNGLLAGFYTQQPAPQSLLFRGDINRLELYPVKPADGSATLYWLPQSIPADQLFLGIGDADKASEGGTASLNYDGNDTGLTAIGYNISAGNLQTALNANPAIIGTGATVDVSQISDGVYQITWSDDGAKELIQGDGANLTPDSVVFSSWLVEGGPDTRAVQILQFLQRPYVYVDSWVEMGGVSATVTELRAGGASAKAMFEVEISPLPYAGSFAIKGSGAMAYNGSQSDWQTALGNGWSVIKTGDARMTIERAEVGEYTLEDSDVDVSGLSVYSGLVGQLSFNGSSLYRRFLSESGDSFVTKLHLRFNDGTNRETLLLVPVTLTRDVLSSGALAPNNWNGGFYTKAEINAMLEGIHAFDGVSTSSTEDIVVSKLAPETKTQTLRLAVGAGGGAYTAKVILDAAMCRAGDITRLVLEMPTSENPTIEVRDATDAGTLLYLIEGTGAASTRLLLFTFNGTSWESDQ